jgi:hypothetical protein
MLGVKAHHAILHYPANGFRMPPWIFREYLTEPPVRSPFLIWYGTLQPSEQAEVDVLIKEMAATEDWDDVRPSRKKYKQLTKKHAGLCELILKIGKRQFRILGVRRIENQEFILLGGLEKAGRGTSNPEDAFELAMLMKDAFRAERGTTRDY